MKLISTTWAKTFCLALCTMSALFTAQADYTWRGTNSTAWYNTNNWLTLTASPTNQLVPNRLDVNNASLNPLVYDVYCGTTIYNGTTGGRGVVVGSGSLGSGTLTINGGTLMTTNTGNDVVGNTSPNIGILNVNGGAFVSATPGLNVSLGSGSVGVFNNNGGFASFKSLILGFNATANFNGGTTAFNSEPNGNNGLCTNNFNGGTVQALTNNTAFIGAMMQANVRSNGAVIDSAGFNITVAGTLAHSVISGDAANDGGLTKLNNGTLTLSSAPAYTGPTVVNGGRLVTPLPQNSSALVLAQGTHFSPTVGNSVWAMNSAALTNASVDFNYGNWSVNSYSSAVMNIASLAISGSVTCNVTGTAFPVTTLTLLTYGSKTGGGSFVLGTIPSGAVATLNDNGSSVTLNITTASIANLIWSGGDDIWQINGGFDWNSGTAQYSEYASGVGDVVSFDDSGPGGTVTVGSQVKPASTTVDTGGTSYTFSGSGSIGGTNGIAFFGTNTTLTILNSNNFTGPVTLSGGSGTIGGMLYVGNSKALGATNGAVTVNGPANTLEVGTSAGPGITVSNKTVIINGTGVGGARGALRGAAVASGTNVWAGPVIIGSNLSRIGTEDYGNLLVTGPITDNGANLGVIFRVGYSGTNYISGGGNNTYGYTCTYGDSTTSYIILAGTNAFSTNSLEIGPGYIDLSGFPQTIGGITDFDGTGNIINNGSRAATLTINTGTNNFATGANIQDGISPVNVVVGGNGQQTFSGNITYSGTTTISGGQLYLTSPNPMNTAITVGPGGALGGQGSTTNSLTLAANSTIILNPTAGAFTANTINATASPIKILLTSTAPTNQATVVLNAVNGISGSAANFQVSGARGGTFYLTNANTQLMFVPSSKNASLVWTGNNPSNPTIWDTYKTTNWINGVSPDVFYIGDNVGFNDTASSYTVAIQGTSVLPTSVTVNSSNTYTFTGVIGGSASVTKAGTGTLFLNNNNSYTGPTIITNGVLAIQTSGALGSTSGGVFISGNGSLDLDTSAGYLNTLNLGATVVTIAGNGYGGMGSIVNNSPSAVQENAVQQLVLAGNASIGGGNRWDLRGNNNSIDMQSTNTLTKVGGNYIALVSTVVNNPGNIVVNGGTLGLQLSTYLNGDASNTLMVNSGGILEMYVLGINPDWTLVLNSNSIVNPDSGYGGWDGPVIVNGPATLQADAVLTINGSITGNGSIIKTGLQTASLTASNSYTGNTIVNAGELDLEQPTLAANSTVIITNNATLNLDFSVTNIVAALVLNGVSQPVGVYDASSGAPFITGSGALQVVYTAPPVLSVANLGGNQLRFSWTGSGTLQSQTNSLTTGLGSNWVNYPGSSPVTITVDPTQGSVFFRVKQ